ncbi:class I SAM-dependent methyltransferase [Candidatus Thorarchaeota archaeon]|nr:MAG: class I SAM-dependent methyltransferase [Candidatus Thorarchaeota archaeon]
MRVTMDEYLRANRDLWDKLAKIHYESAFYDVEGFMMGKQTLDPIEVDELPDISGKKLLHLMCHFGMDTLSLARLGAEVTGVDFSEDAIDLAFSLAEAAKIDARFVCSDVYNLPNVLQDEFDIVFTSGGVLMWLPDLERWAKIIEKFLKPGGIFYIRDFHPFVYIFDDEEGVSDFAVKYPYFQDKNPMMFEDEGSYADKNADTGKMKTYQWNHPISRIINVLAKEDFRIEFFHEFPFCSYKALPFMIENREGRWVFPNHADSVPLMFSIMAAKPW